MASRPTLPVSSKLDIAALSIAFRDTTTSYKFLWAQALLRAIRRNDFTKGVIPISLLVAHMLDIAKYPLRRFHLSFGPEDRMLNALQDLEDSEGWGGLAGTWDEQSIVARYQEIPEHVHQPLVRFVPYRWLSPFFQGDLQGLSSEMRHKETIRLARLSFDSPSPSPYRFSESGTNIEMHPVWKDYMQENLEILRGWTFWNWCNYLQKRNPNIPAISQKLTKPTTTDLNLQRQFWRWVIGKRAGEIRCIYSGEVLSAQDFSIDHYVPWDFIGHDNLWNLIPAKPAANSAKSNFLPNADYLPELIRTQHIALTTFCASERKEWNALMEPYRVDLHLPKLPGAGRSAPALDELKSSYSRVIPPLMQLAQNCGFRIMER